MSTPKDRKRRSDRNKLAYRVAARLIELVAMHPLDHSRLEEAVGRSLEYDEAEELASDLERIAEKLTRKGYDHDEDAN